MPYESRHRQLTLTGMHKFLSLPEICMLVHQHVTGSSDELTPEQFKYHKETLQIAWDNWKEGRTEEADFDNAVKQLIIATLAECKPGMGEF